MNKLVLIKERFDLTPVQSTDDSNIIYLEAPVAVFGEKNNNNRVYEEANYLPLLEELKNKIKMNNLTGELDHPGERLEVFLSNVSHKIEDLQYDEGSRTVKAKIRLIEGTTAGNNAIALHKAGVCLGISSRAIGVIKENKALLKKIITFDVVSTPGFKSAMLKQINESVEFESDAQDFAIYEITDEKYLKKYQHLLEEDEPEIKNNMNTIEEIKALKESFEDLKNTVGSINIKLDEYANYNELHTEKLNEFAQQILASTEDYNKFKNKFIAYNESETQKLKQLKDSVEVIDETMDSFIEMFEEHSKRETEKLNEFVEHQSKETEKLNEFVNHQDKETQKLNSIVEFLDLQSEKLEKFVEHQANESTKLDLFAKWTQDNLERLYENAEFKTFINNKNNLNIDLARISESVDAVLENVRKQKTFKDTTLKVYPFLETLTEAQREEFLALDKPRKTMVVNKINENSITETAEIEKVIKESANLGNEAKWLTNTTEDYQKLWETLNENQRIRIVRLAEMRNFNSQQDIEKFWDSLKLTKELELIKENAIDFDINKGVQQVNKISKDNKLGYSKDYINTVREIIKKNK